MEKKEEKNGEYTRLTPAFSVADRAACMHMIGNKEMCEHVWSLHIAEYGSSG